MPAADVDELSEFKKKIETNMESDLSKIVSILKVLKTKFVSYEMLVKTKIGKNISALSTLQTSKPELESDASTIREISKGILSLWKEVQN